MRQEGVLLLPGSYNMIWYSLRWWPCSSAIKALSVGLKKHQIPEPRHKRAQKSRELSFAALKILFAESALAGDLGCGFGSLVHWDVAAERKRDLELLVA